MPSRPKFQIGDRVRMPSSDYQSIVPMGSTGTAGGEETPHPGIGCTLTVSLNLTTAEARDLNISDMGQVIDVIAETWPALRVRIESNE